MFICYNIIMNKKYFNYEDLSERDRENIANTFFSTKNISETLRNFMISRITFNKIMKEDIFREKFETVKNANKKEISQLSLEILNIPEKDIDRDLSEYISLIESKKLSLFHILKRWKSAKDYVYALYWLKFIKKLSYSEMEDEYKLFGARNLYYTNILNWHYNTNNFDECLKLYNEEKLRLSKVFQDSLKNMNFIMDQEYISFYEKAKKQKFPQSLTIYKSKGQLLSSLWYMIKICKLSPKEVSIATNSSVIAISRACRNYGISVPTDEAMKLSFGKQQRNFSASLMRARNTHLRTINKTVMMGSNLENYCRTYIDTNISKYIDITKFEVVVGVNSLNIIAGKEIDIPIIIINKLTNQVYKYALEIDGSFWHKIRTQMDKRKNDLFVNSSWIFFRIVQEIDETKKELTNKIDKFLYNEIYNTFKSKE